MRVEVIRREPDGTWRHEYFGEGDVVTLRSLDVTIGVPDLYRGWSEVIARSGAPPPSA